MSWYDRISPFYDGAVEWIYRPCRAELAAVLRPESTRMVLDLACGTGQNFPALMRRLGPERSRILGADASPGMLRRARRRVERQGWSGVTLVEADARALDRSTLERSIGGAVEIDAVVCTLGFSVLPDWQRVFERTFRLLRPGGQYVIFDVSARRRVFTTWLVEWIARADLRRRVWEPLERSAGDFELRYLPGSPYVHGGRLLLASGTKPG